MMRKSWPSELEAAGHVVSAVRKQHQMNSGAQLLLALSIQVSTPA